ncbi:MAG TPA: hypothetical protein VH061_13705 [Solirubrobacteraceae bacterium]|nr:hypothetical protein [Solirubrobacteraceae bacterium]
MGTAFGLTEDNADLLWSPATPAPPQAAPFLSARRELTALHPRYLRLLVNWAALQPTPGAPPALNTTVDGCAREVAPCGAYAGIEGELEAIASQQRAALKEGRTDFQVVVDILGAPSWAALSPHGCEDAGTTAVARPVRSDALAAYRSLVSDLLALARRVGVRLAWWSPWNEPNDPRFLSPQRNTCASDGAPLATGVYAQLASALAGQLRVEGDGGRLLLGELGGYDRGSPHRLSIAEFVKAIPEGVACLSQTWAVHAYAARNRRHSEPDPVVELEDALDARGGCATSARVWVTESGAGAPRPGRARTGAPEEGRADCLALAQQVGLWRADPRVRAVFQYTFRDDPAFPVGLTDAELRGLSPVYGMWRELFAQRPPGTLAPSAAQACVSAG